MSQIFTVRWPHFARLEAVLFFPATLLTAIEQTPLRALAERLPIADWVRHAAVWGLSYRDVLWMAMAGAVLAPYLAGLLAVDRLLTVRKGYAVLAILAAAAWMAAGAALAGWLMPLAVPYVDFASDPVSAWVPEWLEVEWAYRLAAGAIALALHLPALWIGARDRGEVAGRLLGRDREDAYETPAGGDVYRRQTADFRRWRAQRDYDDLPGTPREHPAVRVLYAIAWIGVVAGAGFGYYSQSDVAAANASATEFRKVEPIVSTPRRPGDARAVPVQAHAATGMAANIVSSGAPHAANVHPLPRPATPPDPSHPGPNEAISERIADGLFVFDVAVNGVSVRMRVDPDLPSGLVRAEDAARLGLNPSKLEFTSRIRVESGFVEAAPVLLDTVAVGNILARRVPALVVRAGVARESVLGQAFLSRLAARSVENNRMVLKGF